MDETLVRAEFKKYLNHPDFNPHFSIDLHGEEILVSIRPYARDLLQRLSQMYEIIVFTAGEQIYADKILDELDPERDFIQRRFYRADCIPVDGHFVKDLDILLNRDKRDLVIVDNSIMAFAFDLENGIPIKPYFGKKSEEEDKELLYVDAFLEEVFAEPDVRRPINQTFKLKFLTNTIHGLDQSE